MNRVLSDTTADEGWMLTPPGPTVRLPRDLDTAFPEGRQYEQDIPIAKKEFRQARLC